MSQVFPVPVDDRFRIYHAAAGQSQFPVPFPWQDNVDIRVLRTDPEGVTTELEEAEHYQLTGAGEPGGGTLTLNEGLEALEGEEFLIIGAAVLARVSSIVQGGRFRHQGTDNDLDRLTIIAQEIYRELGRTLRTPYGAPGGAVRPGSAGTVPLWSEDGGLVPGGPDVDSIASAEANAAAAAAAANAAAGSAATAAGSAGAASSSAYGAAASEAEAASARDAAAGAREGAEAASAAAAAAAADAASASASAGASAAAAAAALGEKLSKAGDVMTGPIGFTHQAGPAAPPAGVLSLFAKNDNKLYTRAADGTETEVGNGGAPGKMIAMAMIFGS